MNAPSPATPATLMKREDYKTIKHMDRAALTAYLTRIYMRGYEAGQKAGTGIKTAAPTANDVRETE